jgi:uncharacterized protein
MELDQIEKLNDLKQKGLISEEEYQAAKARILQGDEPANGQTLVKVNNNDYSMVLHLSQFCSWLFPFLGLIVPLIMWQNKKEDPYVDQQGKVVMNWVFSSLIYFFISALLCFVLIGIPMLIIVGLCSIIFTILGAIDASKGIIKSYPLSIQFFAVDESSRQS